MLVAIFTHCLTMRWTFGLTQPDIKQAKTFEPLQWPTIVWLLLLLGVYAVAGRALTMGPLPWPVVLFVAAIAIALAWLKTYSWLSAARQSLADFLMPLAGILAALVGAGVPLWLGLGKTAYGWDDTIVLLGLLPATAAFRGSLGFVNWTESIKASLPPSALPPSPLLRWLPGGWVLAIGLSLVCYGLAKIMSPGLFQGLAMVIIALPTAAYLYLAYGLLPQIVGEQIDKILDQLSASPLVKDFLDRRKMDEQTLDIDAIEVGPKALPPTDRTPPNPAASPPSPNFPKNLDAALKDAPKGQWRMQLLVPGAMLLLGSGLISYLYWKINQWIAALVIFGLDRGLAGEITVNWGWDWFKGWLAAWAVAVLIAVVRVSNRIKLWPSLLSTLSIVGGALLIPTALLWGMQAGWSAIASVAWASLLGLALAQSAWGLERTFTAQYSCLGLAIVSLLGLGLGRVWP
jgi:hypothetical protein